MKINGLLSKGTTLAYEENGVLITVSGVKSVPVMGSEPVKVDTTNMLSSKNEYKMGRQDVDTLEFGIIYKGANLDAIDKLVKANIERNWVVTYPDGLTAKFTGKISYKLEAVEVNSAIAFNVAIVVSNGPIITPAPIPTRPENVVASNVTYESFVLTWQGTGRFKVYVDGRSKGETVVNSFKVTGLDENTEYRVVVSSIGPSGEEQSTPLYVRTKQFVLEPPNALQLLEVTHSAATVSWQHSNAEKYKVKIGGKEYETRNKSYNFSNLSENTSYDVSVAAYAKGKWSNYSSTLHFTTKRSKPNKVTGLSYSSLTHNSFTINWGYSDEQFTDPTFEIYLNGQKQTETKSKTYTFNELEEQQSYQVYIVAKQNGAYSDKSEAVTVKTTEFVVEIPYNLKATDKMPTSATILWSSSLSKFKLYLNGEEKETTSDKRVYLKDLAPNTSYYVQVSAYDNGKWSELSERLDFVTSEIPKPSSLTFKDVTMTTATATWLGGSQQYEVYLNNSLKDTITETSYKFTGLSKDTSYTVKIIGIYDSYKSEPVESSFKTQAVPVPYELKTTYLDYKVATVTWKGQGDSFNVYVNDKLEKNTSDKLYTFNLIPESEYAVQVSSLSSGDEGAKTDKLVFKAKQVPSVTNLSVQDSGIDRLSFTWEGVTDCYEVTFDGKTSMTTDTSFSADNLEQGKTYKIRVRAAYSGKFSPYEELEAKTTSVPIPTDITVSDITYKNAKISWNGQADKYKVYLNDEFVKETTQTSYTLDNLVPKMTYNVQIQAFVGTAESDKTTAKTFVTSNVPLVTGLYVQETGYDKLVFTWNGLGSYKIDVDGTVTEQTENVFTIDKLPQGTTKTIKVANVYKDVISDYSTAQATTKQVVDVTGLKLVSKDYKSLSFAWDNVAENYNIIANDINVNVTDTAYTLSDLNADTRYTFKLRAMQDGFVGEFATITETTESVPVPKMEVIPFETSIKVNLSGGTGQFEVKIDNNSYTSISGNTHEFKGLTAGTEYIVYARSVYKGSYSQAVTKNVTTEDISVDKPVVKQAWANRDSVTLVMENTAYQYSISVDGASTKTYGSTAVITGLSKGTSYKFTIKSLSGGNYSEPVEITRNTASGTEITNIGHIKLSKDTAKFFWTGVGQRFDVMLDGNSEDRYTGSEQTCEFSGLEAGKDYRLMIIQKVDSKWSTWYYYNFRLEDETVISDDKPIEPTIEIEPPTNLRIKDVGETTANLIFEKAENSEKTNIYLDDNFNGDTKLDYYILSNLTPDTVYNVYCKSVLDGKESEKSETITFKTDKTGEITEDSYIIDIYPDSFEKEHEWFNSRMLDVAQGKTVEGISTSGVPKKPEITSVEELTVHDFSLVTKINLKNNNLTGEIPSTIGNLSNLTDLTLSNNNLTGEIPSTIGNLSNLKYLVLNNNNLTGEIPSTIGNLSNLKYLVLNNNNLTGEIPSTIGNLSNLTYFILNNNNLTGEIPNSINARTNDLSHNILNAEGDRSSTKQYNFNSSPAKKITIPGTQPLLNSQYKLSELVDIPLENSAKLEEIAGLPVTVEVNGVKYFNRKLRYEDPLITGIPTDQEQNFRIWVYDGDVVKNGMYIEYSISNNLRMSHMATLPPVEEVIKDMPASLNEQQRKTYITSKLAEYQTNNNNIQE